MELFFIGIVASLFILFLLYLFFTSKRFRSKLRTLALGGDNFVSLYPNPGIQLGSFHWCKARGRHQGWQPNKAGLRPGERIDEGEPGYKARMQYLGKE